MEVDGGVASAARRRRERRLRSWWRHEQQSVRMVLNAAAHHSAAKVAAGEEYSGLRAKTTFSAGRPGVLTEPEPQGGAVTVGYVAAPVPLLAGDARTLSFLLAKSLAAKNEEEEEEKRKLEAEEKMAQAVAGKPEFARLEEWLQKRRRKKKRRKRRLPRTSSHSSCGRARRRQRQWLACNAGFSW